MHFLFKIEMVILHSTATTALKLDLLDATHGCLKREWLNVAAGVKFLYTRFCITIFVELPLKSRSKVSAVVAQSIYLTALDGLPVVFANYKVGKCNKANS